jgi:tetratricopeptide (TPR) repeat protein
VITDEVRSRYLRDIEYFSKKIEQNPNSKCYYPLAFAYLQLQKFDDVIEICEKGLEKHPDYMQLATLMGEAYLRKGMLEEARAILESVVKVDTLNFKALKLLGDIYKSENNEEKALEYYKRAYKISPESEELKKILSEFQSNVDEIIIPKAEPQKDEYAIDGDIDKIMDDIFKNLNVSQTSNKEDNNEDENKIDQTLAHSIDMINKLTDKNKKVDELIMKTNIEDPKDKTLTILNELLTNIDKIKKERQLE